MAGVRTPSDTSLTPAQRLLTLTVVAAFRAAAFRAAG